MARDSIIIKAGYWPPLIDDKSNTIGPSAISTSYFTHLFYASVVPDQSNDSKKKFPLKITETDEKWMRIFTNTLHERSQQKALLSIGGRRPDSPLPNPLNGIFTEMVSTSETRKSFIDSSIKISRDYEFDGLDLDWEFPNTPEDKQNLVSLFEEWNAAIEAESNKSGNHRLLLFAAVYYAYVDDDKNLVDAINKYVDFVGVRCYDYHGSKDTSFTAEHSCLRDSKHNRNLNTEYGISTWINAGLNTQKIVMGLPLFGKSWKLKSEKETGVGAPAVGVGPGLNGVMRYYDIVKYIHKNNTSPPPPVYDKPTASMYTYAGTNWIGYDDEKTIREKVEFAKNTKELRGYFLWEIGYDCEDELTKAASDAWDGTAIAH